MKGVVAYRSPIVLSRVAAEVIEPYRTALLVHPEIRVKREELLGAQLADIDTSMGVIRIKGAVLSPKGGAMLTSYLRGFLARIDSPFLFPLPSDPTKPASVGVAKRYMDAIVNDTGGASADEE